MAFKNIKNTNESSNGGGSQRVTIPATPFIVAGTAQPCKYCRLQLGSANTGVTRVNTGSACSSTTGIGLPSYPTLTPYTVDDLSHLNFIGTVQDDVIDIEYFE